MNTIRNILSQVLFNKGSLPNEELNAPIIRGVSLLLIGSLVWLKGMANWGYDSLEERLKMWSPKYSGVGKRDKMTIAKMTRRGENSF